jgi:hemoglobin
VKTKLENIEDVQLLVHSFYTKVLMDEKLALFFKYVASTGWQKHLEGMERFWCNVLFHEGGYSGNPLQVHKALHQFNRLDSSLFHRYMQLFDETVDELFTGDKAEVVKQRALSISNVMEERILGL